MNTAGITLALIGLATIWLIIDEINKDYQRRNSERDN